MADGGEELDGGLFEDHLKFVFDKSSSLDLRSRYRKHGFRASDEPEVEHAGSSFAEYLRALDSITKLQQRIIEMASELHRRQSLQPAHLVIDADVIESRIATLQTIDFHLQTIVANKDHILEQIHTSKLVPRHTTLPVHVSYQENVREAMLGMSCWINNLETNFLCVGLDQKSAVVTNDLSSIGSMIETLLAKINKDLKLIRQQQKLVHRLHRDELTD